MTTKRITRKEMLSEVMTIAHRNFSSKWNMHTWSECLKNAWFAMKMKLKRGFVRLIKKMKPVRIPRVERYDIGIDLSFEYGRGSHVYYGD